MCFGFKMELMWELESNIVSSYPVCETCCRLWSDSICSLALKKWKQELKKTRHTLSSVSHPRQVGIFLPQNSTFSDLFTFKKKAKYTKKEVGQINTSKSAEHLNINTIPHRECDHFFICSDGRVKVMVFNCIISCLKTLWTLVEVQITKKSDVWTMAEITCADLDSLVF